MTLDREIWALTLWIEGRHGPEALAYIAEHVDRMVAEDDESGFRMWLRVARCLRALQQQPASA